MFYCHFLQLDRTRRVLVARQRWWDDVREAMEPLSDLPFVERAALAREADRIADDPLQRLAWIESTARRAGFHAPQSGLSASAPPSRRRPRRQYVFTPRQLEIAIAALVTIEAREARS